MTTTSPSSSSKKAKTYTLKIAASKTGGVDSRPFIGIVTVALYPLCSFVVDDPSLAEARLNYDLLKRSGDRKAHQRALRGESAKINVRAVNFGDKNGGEDFK